MYLKHSVIIDHTDGVNNHRINASLLIFNESTYNKIIRITQLIIFRTQLVYTYNIKAQYIQHKYMYIKYVRSVLHKGFYLS